MLKIDRHSYILNELKKKHLVRVNRLANDMKVTEMTIRRDLKELEDYGHLTRIHGGAKLKPKNFYQEDNFNKKISVNVDEKKEIARKVAGLIKNNETIFIGAGSTTSYLAEFLQDRNINIVTNSMTVFEQFKDKINIELNNKLALIEAYGNYSFALKARKDILNLPKIYSQSFIKTFFSKIKLLIDLRFNFSRSNDEELYENEI